MVVEMLKNYTPDNDKLVHHNCSHCTVGNANVISHLYCPGCPSTKQWKCLVDRCLLVLCVYSFDFFLFYLNIS